MNKVVILVDDNQMELEIMGNILESGGFEVIKLCSSEDVVKIVKRVQPACVVLDVMMPVKSGAELYQELKREKETSQIPTLFVTSCSSLDVQLRKLKLSEFDIMEKPVQMQRLLARVQKKEMGHEIQRKMEAVQEKMHELVKKFQLREV